MNRRQLLALCGSSLTALAGCSSRDSNTPTPADGSEESNTSTPTDTPTHTQTPTQSPVEMSVKFDALQSTVLYVGNGADSYSTWEPGKYLYVIVSLESGSYPEYSDFRFQVDGMEYQPEQTDIAHWRTSPLGDIKKYTQGGTGWLLFSLPERADATDAALLWPGGKWRPSKEVRSRLAAPIPHLSLEWNPPETVPLGTNPTIEFTVRNDGELPSRFVAGLDRTGWEGQYQVLDAFSRVIPANETVSWTYTDTETITIENDYQPGGAEDVGDGGADFRYGLAWAGEKKYYSPRVVEANTAQ